MVLYFRPNGFCLAFAQFLADLGLGHWETKGLLRQIFPFFQRANWSKLKKKIASKIHGGQNDRNFPFLGRSHSKT